jgi:hypothetical protein
MAVTHREQFHPANAIEFDPDAGCGRHGPDRSALFSYPDQTSLSLASCSIFGCNVKSLSGRRCGDWDRSVARGIVVIPNLT